MLAIKYIRYYTTNDIHGYYRKTSEIFIPTYNLAVSIINHHLYVASINEPRTNPPVWNIIDDSLDDNIKTMLENENLQLLKEFPPSDLIEILVTEEFAERIKSIYHLEKNLNQIKNTVKDEFNNL
jgi:hypothetical protein